MRGKYFASRKIKLRSICAVFWNQLKHFYSFNYVHNQPVAYVNQILVNWGSDLSFADNTNVHPKFNFNFNSLFNLKLLGARGAFLKKRV